MRKAGRGPGARRGPGGRTSRFGLLASLAAVAAGGALHPVAAQSLRYSGSLGYATGSYVFDARSHSLYFTNGLTLELGRFEASASVPVVLQNGGVVTRVGDRHLPTGGEGHDAVAHRRGGDRIRTHGGGSMDPGVRFRDAYRTRVGDPFLRAGGELFSGSGPLRSVRVATGVKAPLTDLDSGVGTGSWDYTLGASVMASAGSVFFLGDAAYWWMGDLPELELRDGASWGLAAAVAVLDGRGTLMGSLSGAHRIVRTLDAPVSVGASAGYRPEGPWSLNGGLSVGLTESAADLSVFVGWSRDLGRPR